MSTKFKNKYWKFRNLEHRGIRINLEDGLTFQLKRTYFLFFPLFFEPLTIGHWTQPWMDFELDEVDEEEACIFEVGNDFLEGGCIICRASDGRSERISYCLLSAAKIRCFSAVCLPQKPTASE